MPPNINGNAINPQVVQGILTGSFGIEILYSFVIIVCSLIIYFGTKEIYELSNYKGLKYFRQAFLFFAIAYFFRSFIKFVLIYFNMPLKELSPGFYGVSTLFLFMYFSSMAIFYLLYSIIWKKCNRGINKIFLFHIGALAISSISILSNSTLVYLWLNFTLLIFIIITIYIANLNTEKKRKKHKLFFIYLLLSIFWILNIIDILIPKFLQTYQLIIYLASLGIFLLILYKVIKTTGVN